MIQVETAKDGLRHGGGGGRAGGSKAGRLAFTPSLRLRILALTLAALLPALAVVAYTEWNIDRLRRAEVHDLALRSARLASSELDRIWEGIGTMMAAVALSGDVNGGSGEMCNRYIQHLQAQSPQLRSLRVVEASGRVRCGAPVGAEDAAILDPGWIRRVAAAERLVVGNLVMAGSPPRPVLPVGMPVASEEDERVVLLAAVDLLWLGGRLRERGLPPGGSLTIADGNGTIFAREPLPEQFVGSHIPQAYMRLVRSTSAGSEELTSQDGTRRVLGYVPPSVQPSGLYVSAGLSEEASYGAVSRAARISAYVAGAGALLALLAAWIVGDRGIRRPLLGLIGTVERRRAGDMTARSHYSEKSGEIGALGAALDRMMDRVDEQQEQRDLLVHELDHRVKNILATVQAIATATFRNAERTSDALPQFSERIVALSRAHDILTRENWESADLRVVVDSIARPLDGPGGRFEIAGDSVTLTPRQTLAFTMVLNELRTNAAKYGALSDEDGRVHISWTLDRDTGSVELVWREANGPPVVAPERSGFGTRLIRQGFGRDLGEVSLTYEPTGVICRIRTGERAPTAHAGGERGS
jgi:two-component sensor histidine kinase